MNLECNYPILSTLISSDKTLIVHKRFDFDSHLQRTSVVISTPQGLMVYAKGSPDAIRQICNPRSIPADYAAVHRVYARRGFYVLACAFRAPPAKGWVMPLSTIRRDSVERDMVFCGLMILGNPLKDEAAGVITSLQDAKIRNIIITGDGALTTIHVARSLGIVGSNKILCLLDGERGGEVSYKEIGEEKESDLSQRMEMTESAKFTTRDDNFFGKRPKNDVFGSATTLNRINQDNRTLEDLVRRCTAGEEIDLAITGAALDIIRDSFEETLFNWAIERTKIFARATPNQKTNIVERLIKQGCCVAMCGDGTNDCGALKSAHVGIALSNAEASIVAPFTSANKSILDVSHVLSEGRCALETSFTAFKYMTLYPIIQLLLAATLYQLDSGMSNSQYLFDDLFIVLFLAMYMPYTGPQPRLIHDRPPDDLFSPLILSSILGHILINIIFFFICLLTLLNQTWYCPVSTALKLNPNPMSEPPPPILNLIDNFLIGAIANYTMIPFQNETCYTINPQTDLLNNLVLISTHENTVLWLFSHFQFAAVALALSLPVNYRRPVWTNVWFLLHLVLASGVMIGLVETMDDHPAFSILKYMFGLREGVTEGFRTSLWILAGMNAVMCIVWEVLVVDVFIRMWVRRRDANSGSKGEDGNIKIRKLLIRGAFVQYLSSVVVAAKNSAGVWNSRWTNRGSPWNLKMQDEEMAEPLVGKSQIVKLELISTGVSTSVDEFDGPF
ncbi:hypothetical protein HK096_005192, partial [Nowakowskiella sp. JEL0078]